MIHERQNAAQYYLGITDAEQAMCRHLFNNQSRSVAELAALTRLLKAYGQHITQRNG